MLQFRMLMHPPPKKWEAVSHNGWGLEPVRPNKLGSREKIKVTEKLHVTVKYCNEEAKLVLIVFRCSSWPWSRSVGNIALLVYD